MRETPQMALFSNLLDKPMAKPKLIRSIVEDTLKGLEIDGYVRTHSIFFKWSEIVGEQIAQQAQPRSIHNRILFLDVSRSTWMQQLQFLKTGLLQKIGDFLGDDSIQDIRFRLGNVSVSKPAAPKVPFWDDEPLDEKTIRGINNQVQKIEDEETREALRNVLVKGAKVERYRRKSK
jgi:hypothetical protein